jgi:hypothetical protein
MVVFGGCVGCGVAGVALFGVYVDAVFLEFALGHIPVALAAEVYEFLLVELVGHAGG